MVDSGIYLKAIKKILFNSFIKFENMNDTEKLKKNKFKKKPKNIRFLIIIKV